MSRNRLRLLGSAAVAAVAIVASAGAASAHVEVIPDTATQGGEATLAFQVPNEEALNTIKVEVQLPTEPPLTSVALQPHPGWTATKTTVKLPTPIKNDDGDEVTEAVRTITWTATTGAAIKPGEFDQFVISVGPLPKADSMQFKTLQTYSDNSIVRWIDPAKPDGSEPEHPAPTLKLTPAVAEGASSTATTGSAAAAKSSSTTASASSAASQSSVNIALGLSVAALIVGLIAAALALRRRSPAAGPGGS